MVFRLKIQGYLIKIVNNFLKSRKKIRTSKDNFIRLYFDASLVS